jgi:hypothetical protein
VEAFIRKVQSDIANGKINAADGNPLVGMASDLVRFLDEADTWMMDPIANPVPSA